MNEDFTDLLAELLSVRARFLVVGAHAVAVHGIPRAPGDLDVWIDPHVNNVPRVWSRSFDSVPRWKRSGSRYKTLRSRK